MADVFDNIIILRSVFGKVGMKYFMNPCRDPKTGRYPDHVKPVNANGDIILTEAERNSGNVYIPENKVYIIEDGKTFNLNDPYEAAEWYAIQHCPMIAMSRDQRDKRGNLIIDGDSRRYGSAELYVERPGYETHKKVSRKKLIFDAQNLIFNDKQGKEGHIKMARLLGKNMKNAPSADIEDFLLKMAEKEPQVVIDLYTGDDAVYRLLFLDASDKHIIYTKNKFYMYGEQGIVLGATDDAAITWMKNPANKRIVDMIKRETYPEYYQDEAANSSENTKETKKSK